MKKIIVSLFLAFIFSNCSQKNNVEHALADTVITDTIKNIPVNESEKSTGNFLQRDSLLFTWYDGLINITHSDLNFISEKKPQLNKYITGQIDTIERLTFKESNLLIYHTIDKNILISSDIRNTEIPLSKEIKVGVSRIELLKTLNTESNRDTITVTDFENNTSVTLILKNNFLSRIIYSGYID
ncbi:MAG TPA: hypothetical protein VK796_11865 [Cytophaga sp.]|jgi:hypothetical protein|nr:hypothetical protein [Cytophaga sp.]